MRSTLIIIIMLLRNICGICMSERLDKAGMFTSLLCIAHCLFLPLLALLAPLYWLQWFEAEWVHALLLLITLPIAGAALVKGFLHHGQLSAIIVGAWGGFMLLLAVVIGHDYSSWETPITVAGATALVIAHLGNIMMTRRQSFSALRAE